MLFFHYHHKRKLLGYGTKPIYTLHSISHVGHFPSLRTQHMNFKDVAHTVILYSSQLWHSSMYTLQKFQPIPGQCGLSHVQSYAYVASLFLQETYSMLGQLNSQLLWCSMGSLELLRHLKTVRHQQTNKMHLKCQKLEEKNEE